MYLRKCGELLVACRWRSALPLVLCLGLVACAPPAPSKASFKLPVNLLCTTCNDFMRCDAGNAAPAPGQTPLTVYRLREKSFWAQIATIGDYPFQWLKRKTSDRRPYTLYKFHEGAWHVAEDGMAFVDTVAARIEMGKATMDQGSGAWTTPEESGVCRAMPRREGFALIRQMLGKQLPGAAP